MWSGMSATWKIWMFLYLYSNKEPNSQTLSSAKLKEAFWKIAGLALREYPALFCCCVALLGTLNTTSKLKQIILLIFFVQTRSVHKSWLLHFLCTCVGLWPLFFTHFCMMCVWNVNDLKLKHYSDCHRDIFVRRYHPNPNDIIYG